MEKYNLNEGNDALKRVLLMMKYDAKKTLTENIEEMESVNEDTADVAIGSTAVGAGLGAATMGGAAAANVLTTTALGSAAYSASGVGAALGATSVTGAAALGGAVIAGGAALLVLPLVYWLITKDTGANKVKKMFEMCSTDAAKIAKLPRKLGETDLRSITDDIDDAIN